MLLEKSNINQRIICYDDDDDEESSIPLRDIIISELLPYEVIKSSVEDLVHTPSESEGIPDNMCDVPFRDNSPPFDISKDQFEGFSDSNDDSNSIDRHYEAFFCDSEPDSGDFTMDSFMIKSPIPVEDGDSFLEKFETTLELEKLFKFVRREE
ncbi:hypothetical protein Tco_0619339 [Tanacetum coccineum]